jgi:hypothetical protein
MSNNELMHYGVLGMKWGKRKTSIGNRYHSRAARSVQKDADELRKSGYESEAKAVQKVADKHRAKAVASQKKYDVKQERKQAINKAYENIRRKELTSRRIAYQGSVYKQAAKNMVDKGMDQKTAVSKAKIAAWRNYGLMVAGQYVYRNRNKIISSVKKYANQKAMQRANAGLAKIGTMKLVKVAGNVYEYKMK